MVESAKRHLKIIGGRPISGCVDISSAKNAALPIMIAMLLSGDQSRITNVPQLEDIRILISLLKELGCEIAYSNGVITGATPKILSCSASYDLVRALRASFWILGPLLARAGEAHVALPGGDAIGTRPVDIHLAALTAMGADIKLEHGVVSAKVGSEGLSPIDFTLPYRSVGATHQILLTAALIPGMTIIRNAAREPEVVALCNFLDLMGCDTVGAGTDQISIVGQDELIGGESKLIPDRIEAGTYALLALATGGEVKLNKFSLELFGEAADTLRAIGAKFAVQDDGVIVSSDRALSSAEITTDTFPAFPTDLHPPIAALLSVVAGTSKITETVFDGRFKHVGELVRLGAQISVHNNISTIHGVSKLSGAPVDGHDIRGAAALVIAAAAAEGTTMLSGVHHLARGYEKLLEKCTGIGLNIELV